MAFEVRAAEDKDASEISLGGQLLNVHAAAVLALVADEPFRLKSRYCTNFRVGSFDHLRYYRQAGLIA